MSTVEFVLTGDPVAVKATVTDTLVGHKFRITWYDDWTATAERGNKVAYAVTGALAQYLRLGLRVMSDEEGVSVLRLEQLSSGWVGGAIGARRTKTTFAALRRDLKSSFEACGTLVALRHTPSPRG